MRDFTYGVFNLGLLKPTTALMTASVAIMTLIMTFYAISSLSRSRHSLPLLHIRRLFEGTEHLQPRVLCAPKAKQEENITSEALELSSPLIGELMHSHPLQSRVEETPPTDKAIASFAFSTEEHAAQECLAVTAANSMIPENVLPSNSLNCEVVVERSTPTEPTVAAPNVLPSSPLDGQVVYEPSTPTEPTIVGMGTPFERDTLTARPHLSPVGNASTDHGYPGNPSCDVSCNEEVQPEQDAMSEEDASAHIMQSALLVEDGAGALDEPFEGDEDGARDADWTSVDHTDTHTSRATTPLQQHLPPPPQPEGLAASAVLLTESELVFPAALPAVAEASDSTTLAAPSTPSTKKSHPTLPDLTNTSAGANADQSPDSHTPLSPASRSARVHTPDRPDWAVAVAAQDQGAEADLREKRMRRHSYEHPDWAVAPEAGEEAASELGRRSLDGSSVGGKGRKRTARRGRHSR